MDLHDRELAQVATRRVVGAPVVALVCALGTLVALLLGDLGSHPSLRLAPLDFHVLSPLVSLFVHEGWVHGGLVLLVLLTTGSILEGRWGSLRYLGFLLGGVAFGAALTLGLTGLFQRAGGSGGAASLALASVTAWATLEPDRRFGTHWPTLGVLAWVIVLLASTGLLLLDAARGSGTFYLAQVAGAPLGILLVRSGAVIARGRAAWALGRAESRARRLAWMHGEVDRLLGKIGREGLRSLSSRERAFLERSSRHFRRP